MSEGVFLAVLAAALMHAAWSAAIKGDANPRAASFAIAVGAIPIALPAAIFSPAMAPAAWPFLAASVFVHLAYFQLLTAAYQRADLGLVYPLSRGAAPALAALASLALGLEALSLASFAGLALLLAGATVLALPAWRNDAASRLAILLALATAACTATYTLIDGHAARASDSVIAYVAWQMCLTGLTNGAYFVWRGGASLTRAAAQRWRLGLMGGAVSGVAYAIVLWAMTQAPIAQVAALRETSIAFAAGIGILILGEKATAARLVGAGLILAGAMVLRSA